MKQFYNNINNPIVESTKILLYKENKNIFDILDFENDTIYQEPLLFAFFNNKPAINQTVESVICGYSNKNIQYNVLSDEFGRIYIPNIGWFLTKYKETTFLYDKFNSKLLRNGEVIEFEFEKLEIIPNTTIELLKYSIPLLKKFYYNTENELLDVEIEYISKKHFKHLTKAYNLIKINIPSQFELIEKYAPKCVIFNVDTYQRNSFATLSAHGIGFYNAYQNNYDEVFFVDDIAHQTGHVIFNAVTFEAEQFFKVDKSTILETIKMPSGDYIEDRNLHTIFHALYTYYTSFICLDTCLENNVFKGKQRHESMGRIAFYISKCYRDLLLIDNPINSEVKANEYFTEQGLLIYTQLKSKWKEMYNKWFEKVKHFEMSNQPYNFTYSKFIELNPIFTKYNI